MRLPDIFIFANGLIFSTVALAIFNRDAAETFCLLFRDYPPLCWCCFGVAGGRGDIRLEMASVRGSRTSSVAWKITQVLGGAILFRDYVAEAAMCTGESMLPTLKSEGDVILIEKVSLALGHIDRGDVIVTVSPTDPAKLICKRVLGLV